MSEVLIRRARPEDAADLTAVIDAAYAPVRASLPNLPAVSDGVALDIAENLVWVATADGAILGGLILIAAGDHALLANVAVVPDAGGRGIGRDLIALAEAAARDLGLAEIRLRTHARMAGNLALYERLGWRETGRDGDGVRMSKPLS